MTRRAAAAVFLAAFLAGVLRVCPTVFPDDTPETIIAAVTLGIAHPPGDAPLSLLGKAWSALPFGNVAMRLNLLSAALGAAAVVLLARLASSFVPAGLPATAAILASLLAFLFNPLLVQQMAVAKGATYMFNFVLVLAAFHELSRARLLSGAMLMGLLFSHHWMTFTVLLPAFGLAGFPGLWIGNAVRRALLALLAFAMGASLMLALPVRAAAHPGLNWGDVSSFPRFRAHLTRQAYIGTELKGTSESWKRQAVEGISAVARQAGWAEAVLAAAGIAGLAFLARPALLVALAGGIAPWLASVFYFDLRADLMYLLGVFLLPSWLALAFLASVGAGLLAAQRRIAFILLAAVLLSSIASFQSTHLAPYDASRATWSFDAGRALLSPLPPRSGLALVSDLDTFPAWYMQRVEGFRPDVLVANRVMMRHAWYRAELSRASGVERLADLEDANRAIQHLIRASNRPWATCAGPVEGIPREMYRIPYHLTFRLLPEPQAGTYPRGFPMRAFTERIAHLPEPTASYVVGYTSEALMNLGIVPGK